MKINPHICYILGFVVSILAYQLGWSEVYPPLSFTLLFFLCATIVFHLFLSRAWNKKRKHMPQSVNEPKISPWLVTLVLYFFWTLDFLHEEGIPLIKVLTHQPYDYKQFGVPSLHVFTVTFASFYSIYLLYFFLITKEKKYVLLYLINMSAALLIYSRSMLFFNLAGSFFLYLLLLKKIPLKIFFIGAPLVLVLFFFFGVVGTKRVSEESRVEYNQNLFLDNGKATKEFRESVIPKEFFWSYFYISSPLANLQVNINTFNVKPITVTRVMEFINNEILFESFSKRVNKLFDIEREKENVIKDPFNVSTVYSRSYSYLGWIGMIFMGLVVLVIPILYFQLIKTNPHQEVAVAILCCTYLYLSYDNMIRLMALGFQLVYPVIFPHLEKWLKVIKKTS